VTVRLRVPLAVRSFRMLAASVATLPGDLWCLTSLLRRRRVTVVNVHFPDLTAWAFLVLRVLGLFRGEILLSVHGAEVTAIGAAQGLERTLWRLLLRGADGVVACSDALRADVVRIEPRARVVAIHNGADFALFDHPHPVRAVRRAILHVAKFEHKKAQDVLLKAMKRLLGTVPDASLTLVGAAGPELAGVRALVTELGLEGHVKLHVDVPHEQLPPFFGRADVFVLPSRAEPFGIVLLEAGAAGLPVVASAVGGIPELIEDGVTGLLVPPDDVASLEQALRTLLVEPARADRLAEAWHRKAVTTWSWDRTCAQYLKVLNECKRSR